MFSSRFLKKVLAFSSCALFSSMLFVNDVILAVDPPKDSIGVYDSDKLKERYCSTLSKDDNSNAVVVYRQCSSESDPREVQVWNYPGVFMGEGLYRAIINLLNSISKEKLNDVQMATKKVKKVGLTGFISSASTAITGWGKTGTAVSEVAKVLGVEEKFVVKAIEGMLKFAGAHPAWIVAFCTIFGTVGVCCTLSGLAKEETNRRIVRNTENLLDNLIQIIRSESWVNGNAIVTAIDRRELGMFSYTFGTISDLGSSAEVITVPTYSGAKVGAYATGKEYARMFHQLLGNLKELSEAPTGAGIAPIVSVVVICPICKQGFASNKALGSHILAEHPDDN